VTGGPSVGPVVVDGTMLGLAGSLVGCPAEGAVEGSAVGKEGLGPQPAPLAMTIAASATARGPRLSARIRRSIGERSRMSDIRPRVLSRCGRRLADGARRLGHPLHPDGVPDPGLPLTELAEAAQPV